MKKLYILVQKNEAIMLEWKGNALFKATISAEINRMARHYHARHNVDKPSSSFASPGRKEKDGNIHLKTSYSTCV